MKKIIQTLIVTAIFATSLFAQNWLSDEVPSLYQTYKDQFDYFGIACEYGNFGSGWGHPQELYYKEIQKGLAKHANSITMGNELKPQFMFNWWGNGSGSGVKKTTFKASNGLEIKVPANLSGFERLDSILQICKDMNIQMRGHVLVWHSQTPDDFFAENYSAKMSGKLIKNMVNKETMDARQEWYIKTLLEHIAAWEEKNGYAGNKPGKHIIYAWDVVNEAAADDALTSSNKDCYLRGSTANTKNKAPSEGGSRWYQCYGDVSFIENAFRYANAYAPSDVLLCYNDYNEYMNYNGGYKTNAICNIIDAVKNGEEKTVNGKSVKPRIDVMGMQSHVGITWPGVNGYENAVKVYLSKGVDVHVSELDFSAETEAQAEKAYSEYLTMLQKYGKSSEKKNKVTCVTVWGINNESSWINPSHPGGKKTFPLLFTLDDKEKKSFKDVKYDTGSKRLPSYDEGDTYLPTKSYWAVINAHK